MSVRLDLWPASLEPLPYSNDESRPWLEFHPSIAPRNRPAGAVIVFPGGGYAGRADYESAPVARAFQALGLHGVSVEYRVAPNRHPAPICDAARAVRIVRHYAQEWAVDPDRIAVLGFSAGGHLAGSIGVLASEVPAAANDVIEDLPCRPNAMVLCYPVITASAFGHRGSMDNLLGADATPEQRQAMSLELRVDRETPPAFLWHTANDQVVQVENVLLMARALSGAGRPFELHVYPDGPHGMALSAENAHVGSWVPLAHEWLRTMGW